MSAAMSAASAKKRGRSRRMEIPSNGDVGSGISRLRARRRRRSVRLVRRHEPVGFERRERFSSAASSSPAACSMATRSFGAAVAAATTRSRELAGRVEPRAERDRRARPGLRVGCAALEGLPELLGGDPRAPVGALCRLPPEGAQRTDARRRRPRAAEERGVSVRSRGRRCLGLLWIPRDDLLAGRAQRLPTLSLPRKTSSTRIPPVVSAIMRDCCICRRPACRP